MKVSGSILSSSIKAIDIVKEFDKTNIDYIHLDIMDGKFTKNKTWTYGEIKKLTSYTNKKLDVHFMVKDPKKYLDDYAMLNTEYFIFHYETVENIDEMIELVKSYGLKVGISINPKTNVKVLFPYLSKIDQVLIMSVVPGKSGQSFIDKSLDKVTKLKEEIIKQDSKCIISIDGGINEETAPLCVSNGVDMLVSASYLHKDIQNNLKYLKNLS